MRTLFVTGANGYIGRHLVEAARASGWHVIAATRDRVDVADAWVPYRLEEPPAVESFPRDAVIVHLAANTGATAHADIEIKAAERLIALARLHGTRIVFVSSQTARADAPTQYGRTKWAIQTRMIAAGGTVIRPGLVYGGAPGGLYAALLRLLRGRAMLPRFVPSPRVQPVHVADLASALLVAAARDDLAGQALDVARLEPVAFDDFLRTLAIARFGHAPRFVPVPAFVVPAAVTVLRMAGARTLAARVASLLDLPLMDGSGDRARLGVALRPFAEGVQRHRPERRALVREASSMLRYMLGRRASIGARRRYARHVERMREGRAFGLPGLVHTWPAVLRALDQRAWLRRHPSLDWRFALALTIAEASREGATRFLGNARPTNPAVAIARLAGIGVLEAVTRIGGAPLRAAIRPRFDGG